MLCRRRENQVLVHSSSRMVHGFLGLLPNGRPETKLKIEKHSLYPRSEQSGGVKGSMRMSRKGSNRRLVRVNRPYRGGRCGLAVFGV